MSQKVGYYNSNSVGVYESSIQAYLVQVSKIKILSHEQEKELTLEVYENKSSEAAQKLMISHLPLVVKLAFSYKGYGLQLSDLISEGNIGLMKAITKFDPRKGFRLSTYAIWWIKAYITSFVLDSWSLVKQGTALSRKKLFFSLSKIKMALGLDKNLDSEGITSISKIANVSEQDVININNMITSRDISLNTPLNSTNSDGTMLEDIIESDTDNPEEIYSTKQEKEMNVQLVNSALSVLNEREQYILNKRYINNESVSLESIGKELNLSRERVRQIEKRALQKAKQAILDSGYTA